MLDIKREDRDLLSLTGRVKTLAFRRRLSARARQVNFGDGGIPAGEHTVFEMQWRKGRAAHHLLAEFPHLKEQFWGRHLWARGYFCCSSGNVTDDIIAKYIAERNIDQDKDFKVDG
jgi:Transposase IS200 like